MLKTLLRIQLKALYAQMFTFGRAEKKRGPLIKVLTGCWQFTSWLRWPFMSVSCFTSFTPLCTRRAFTGCTFFLR